MGEPHAPISDQNTELGAVLTLPVGHDLEVLGANVSQQPAGPLDHVLEALCLLAHFPQVPARLPVLLQHETLDSATTRAPRTLREREQM